MQSEILINFLKQIPINSNISIFPATKLSICLYQYIKENRPDIIIPFFIDSFKKGFVDKVEIISPEEVAKYDKNINTVIIASFEHQKEIEMICEKLGLNNNIKLDKIIFDFLNGLRVSDTPLYTEQREWVPSGHYYSVQPTDEDIEKGHLKAANIDYKAEGIDINLSKQLENLEFFRQYIEKIIFPEDKQNDKSYYTKNKWFNVGAGFVLASMMLKNKPKQIIEIGSGFSTAVMCDINKDYLNLSTKITCIEPDPERLKKLLGDRINGIVLYSQKLQDVDIDVFSSLQENDILFIDSSHVAKINSDVLKIFYNILPSLNKGVIIHFHDIQNHFEYCKSWLKEGRYWNEAYFLKAFLQFNEKFKIEFYNDFISEYIKNNNIIFSRLISGGSIYLRKI